ncbi:hypothetical protein [Micromonospora sp. CPCC 205556]|uniref:hypothetical protein n=1 Tax=Micromonospora sp. CPCC 205556 TaxID=3122398 RepID=UPI002FEF57BB
MVDASDEFAELEELRRQADDLRSRLLAGNREAAESSARDSREGLRVALTSDGRVDLVEMLADWRRRLPPEELGSAIVEAADEATRRRTEAWAHGISSHASGDLDAPEATDFSWLPASGSPVDESAVNFARGLFYVLKDSSARLDDMATELEQAAKMGSTGSDSSSRVTAVLSGDRLCSVTLDQRWLASAEDDQVSGAVTAAIAAAYANRAAVRAQWQESWPFNELDRMTADPFQLFANLGLMTRDPRGSG